MKHIVFILGSFYPTPSANGICSKKIIDEIKKNNKVSVVCKSIDNGPQYIQSDGVDIYFVNNLRNKLWNYAIKKNSNDRNKILKLFYKFFIFLLRVIRLLCSMFFWPSSEKWFISKGLKELEKINSIKEIDAVVSVSLPYEAHVCAQRYKKHHPDIKWITYTLDPFTNSTSLHKFAILKKAKRKKNIESETSIYADADMNFISIALSTCQNTILKNYKNKIKFISFPLVSKLESKVTARDFDKDKINLMFAGTFYKEIRNPTYLLKLFSSINNDKLILHLFSRGNCEEIIQHYTSISKNIINHGSVSVQDIYNAMEQADILVNVGNSIADSFPSKLLEYISTGKPIINIYNENSSYSDVLSKYTYVLNILQDFNNIDSEKKNFLEFCIKNYNKRISFDEISRLYEESTPEYIAKLFNEIIKN